MVGILNLRSLGNYKIKQGILQQNLSKYYKLEQTFCANSLINSLIH